MKVGLISIGYGNFECGIAGERMEETDAFITQHGYEVTSFHKVLTDKSEIKNAVSKLENEHADCLILQCGTFCGGEEILALAAKIQRLPVVLWGFPEPEAGKYEKIAVNSMTAFLMASGIFQKMGVRFEFMFGCLPNVSSLLLNHLKALNVCLILKQSKFMTIGGRAPGFYFSSADELKFQKTFGTQICRSSVEDLVKRCKSWDSQKTLEAAEKIVNRYGSCRLDRQQIDKAARMYLSLKEIKKETGTGAFAVRCWPEMQDFYDFAPCAVLGMLGDEGIICSCEGDIPGLMTMYIGHLLSGSSVFFADLVNYNENGNLKFWHCGCAPVSLAEDPEKTQISIQPTLAREVGAASSFVLKHGDVTVCQLKETDKGYLFWSAAGTSEEKDRMVSGNQMDVRMKGSWENILNSLVCHGIGQHFTLVYGDIKEELNILLRWLSVDCVNV